MEVEVAEEAEMTGRASLAGTCKRLDAADSVIMYVLSRHILGLHPAGKLKGPRERPEETPQQQRAKEDYYSWRRLIKNPPKPNDNRTSGLLWNDALKILNGEDRD